MLLKPLSASIAQLEHVAAGDLTHTLNAPASQEFNRLNAAIEGMRQSLMDSVLRVRDASSQIDTGSRELTAGNMNPGSAHGIHRHLAGADGRQHGRDHRHGET